MKKIINWKLFFILLIACVIGSLLVLPYSLSLTSVGTVEELPVENELPVETDIPIWLIVISTITNSLIMFAIVIFIGLLLSKKIGLEKGGLRLPILEGILKKENKAKEFKALLLPSICLGVLAGGLIIVVSIPFNNIIPEFQNIEVTPSPWKGFLASFYGGIAEEVLLRLFLMSFFVWLTYIIKKNKEGNPTAVGVWISIILAAVVFGIGHLPATAQIVSLNGIVIARAIVLNGICGVIFGWLYWKKGLESAMIAHFSTDIVLHVITPVIVQLFVSAA